MDSDSSDPIRPRNDPMNPDLSNDEEPFEEDFRSHERKENYDSYIALNDTNDDQNTSVMERIRPKGQRKRTYGTAFPCEYCHCSYKAKIHLTAHMATIHKDKVISSGNFECDFAGCDKSFASQWGLKIHGSKHKRDEGEKKEVENREDESSTAAVRSRRTILRPKRLLSDDETGEETQKKEEKDKEEDSAEVQFPCPKCRNNFKNELYLKFHLEAYHTESEPPFCRNCGELFYTMEALKDHSEKKTCEKESREYSGSSGYIDSPVSQGLRQTETGEKGTGQTGTISKRELAKAELAKTELSKGELAKGELCSNANSTRKQAVSPFSEALYAQSFYNYESDRPSTSGVSRVTAAPMASSFSRLTDRLSSRMASSSRNTGPAMVKSVIPLSTAVYTRSQKNSSELMLIWCNYLEEDLLTSVSLSPLNAIICSEKLDFINMTEKHKNILQDANVYSFVVPKTADTYSPWTVITFGILLSELNNRIFKKIEDVEKMFIEYAKEHGMGVSNSMKYNDDILENLFDKLSCQILVFNCPK